MLHARHLHKLVLLALCVTTSPIAVMASPEEDFVNPPREAGVRCWWWWLNSNVTKEAITRDLEAMHEKGFSGAMIFDAGTELWWGPDANPPNGPQFGGPEWTALYLHALNEAKRLNLKIGLSIQSGWNLGGPSVSLDDKAKQLTASEIQVEGGEPIRETLPVPQSNYGYYRDICVLAWPRKARVAALAFSLRASTEQPGHSVDNINMPGAYWVSRRTGPSRGKPQWIDVQFETEKEVAQLRIRGQKGYGPKICRLRAMDTKETTGDFDLKDGENTLSFKPISGKHFRVIIGDSYDPRHPNAPRNVQVAELEFLDSVGKELLGAGRRPVRELAAKSGAKELGGSSPDCRFLLDNIPATPGEEDARLADILDITAKLDAKGVLRWDAPAGPWTVMRIGYTPTLARVKTSSDNWKGHVLDYLSAEVFNGYWDEHIEPLMIAAGDMAGTVLTQLETDSWECGGMNWSSGFASDFKAYNGYGLTKYLPVVAGKIIESREVSNAFLADLRKTIAHCVSENHYKTFAERAARHGIGIQPECSGPHAAPIDGITNYKHSDIVMSEFWIPSPFKPGPHNRFFIKQAASSAHIYGKRLVGAESFTSIRKPHWGVELWRDMKPSMDYEFCEGLNMIFFHTFTCSPEGMGIPGQEYFAGTHVNPQVTWWGLSGEFIDYMNRIQAVVQQGTFVADVLYYYGDHVPNIAVYKGFNQAGALPGYDYDVTNEEVLLQLKVAGGTVVVPSGLQYRVLVLPDHKVLSLAALETVNELLQEGATVLGPKPERLVSLVGGGGAQQRFHSLADGLWGGTPDEHGERQVGKGRLVWGESARALLQRDGLALDFEALGTEEQSDYEYIHYTIGQGELYFVCNQTDRAQEIDLAFRVTGKHPELWNPITGESRKANAFVQKDGCTIVPMEFDAHGSWLFLFRDEIAPTTQGSKASNFPSLKTVAEISGPWSVAFEPEWGGPEKTVFPTLTDWAEHKNKGIRHYSGTATYANAFELSPEPGKRYWLQLNDIQDVGIAQVALNAHGLGVVWTSPFRIEITKALKSGGNTLEVTMANSWQNRLIGDRGKKQKDRYTRTNIKVKDQWKLRPSGLLGPVEIKADLE